MFLFDNRITIEDRPLLEEYLGSFEYRNSGMSFTSLYMWRNINRFSWQIFGDYLCIAGISNFEHDQEAAFMFPPLTRTGTYEPEKLRETVLAAKDHFEAHGRSFMMRLLPFHMMDYMEEAFPRELLFLADRDNYDYVYLTKDLIELKGKDLHPKKNHLNYFHNNYPQYEYRALTSDMADEAMEFLREFNRRKQLPPEEMKLLLLEEKAMEDVLYNLEKVGYLTGAIFIDGKLEALCNDGRLGRKSVTDHVEKANTEYRGLYQAINHEFCKHQAANVKYINREEDMGIPGLRKAKLSYKPFCLGEVYTVLFKKIV